MNKQEEIFLNSNFDYQEFLHSGFLSDCEIRVFRNETEYEPIKSHRYILSNSSEFFFNIFTSGMKEASTCIVSAKVNPENLLPKVISWMYDGKLSFDFEQVVPLMAIARCYVIPKLTSELHKFLNNNLKSSNVLRLVKKCYDLELPSELEALEKYLTKYLLEIPIEDLSNELDVFVFARIVKNASISTDLKIKIISKFLEGYETSINEKEALASVFDASENDLKQILEENNVNWLPEVFMRSLR